MEKLLLVKKFAHEGSSTGLVILELTCPRSWGRELHNPVMCDVKKYFPRFGTKLLPKGLFQCPRVLASQGGTSCGSQMSIFGAFQGLKTAPISHLPTLSQAEESSFIQRVQVKRELRRFHRSSLSGFTVEVAVGEAPNSQRAVREPVFIVCLGLLGGQSFEMKRV